MIQNDDIKVRLTITMSGTPAIIDELLDYHVYLYFDNNGVPKLLATYKKDLDAPWNIEVEDSDAGIITIVIPRTIMRSLPKGVLYAEVKIQMDAGAEYIDGKSNAGKNGLEIGEVLPSANPTAMT